MYPLVALREKRMRKSSDDASVLQVETKVEVIFRGCLYGNLYGNPFYGS